MRFEPFADGEAAEWIRQGCTLNVPAVGSLVPLGFEEYIALPHPIQARLNLNLTWTEVAAASEVDLSGIRSAEDLLPHVTDEAKRGLVLDPTRLELQRPETGCLPKDVLESLIDLLGPPDYPTIFATWDGWYPSLLAQRAAHVKIGGRGWYLLQAPLDMAAVGFTFGDHSLNVGLGPGMWWPTDRSWIVVTDVDLEATHLGCSSRLADALLNSAIECHRVELTDRLVG